MEVCYLARSRTAGTRMNQVGCGFDGNRRARQRAGRRHTPDKHCGRIRIIVWVEETGETGVATAHWNDQQHGRDQEQRHMKSTRLLKSKSKSHPTLTIAKDEQGLHVSYTLSDGTLH